MADSAIAVTAGSGTSVDTRTEATNGNHRQVIVIGDPSVNAGVAPVDATNGLSVSITNASLTVGSHAVTGNVASGAADSGNPNKVAGVYNSTLPTFTTGQRGDLQIGSRGSLNVQLMAADSASGVSTLTTAATGVALSSVGLRVAAMNYISNGTTLDVALSGNGTVSPGVQRVTIASDSSGNIATIGTSVTPGTGALNLGKAEDAAHTSGDVGVMALGVRKDTAVALAGIDGDYQPFIFDASGRLHVSVGAGTIASGTAGTPSADVVTVQGVASMTPVSTAGYQVEAQTDVTRPADTTAYTANDAWADSTSAPTSGGFTLTGAGRTSGGSGVITDIMFTSSAVPGTLLQGELHIFKSAPTAINDNAAWNLSDADAKLRIAIVPFTLLADANNSYYHAQNLNIGYTCSGSANLRFLIKVKNAYTPASAEVLTVCAKCIQTN